MNLADSENLAGVLTSAGYQETATAKEADILLVNACVVRQNAEDKASWYITSAKGLKKENPQLKIGVCGCIVTKPDSDLPKQFPHVDIFIAPNQPERLVEFLELNAELRTQNTEHRLRGEGITAWVTIMHGCDNFCSYCIVPYVRGRESSRPVEEILNEIKQVDTNQYKEIFLLGQNVNSYKYGLADLLRRIEALITDHRALSTEHRVRFMTSHPRDMSDEIINAVAELPHVCEYFHLPIQHGDDQILKSMNRGYNTDYYLKLVAKIRAKMPQAAITSDVIVGYPGETDEQFKNTLKMIDKVSFDACNTAAYSIRPKTAASKICDSVSDKIKQERLQEVMKIVNEVTLRNNKQLVGREQEVLVDYQEKERCSGRTRTNKIVKFGSKKDNLLGKLVSVKITSALSWVLHGEVINGKF